MKINKKDSDTKQYVIISYSHADNKLVNSELQMYDEKCINYWIDDDMKYGAEGKDEGYKKQFIEMLDKPNCKGIIFFISNDYLLSKPCANEMKYFQENYGNAGKLGKFCLVVLPEGYPTKNDDIFLEIKKYVKENNKLEKIFEEGITNDVIKEHINLFIKFYKINEEDEHLFGIYLNVNDYIDRCCKDGGLFYNAGIIENRISYEKFGYFPQLEGRKAGATGIELEQKERQADKKPAYKTQVEWYVIDDNQKTKTLLSKKLLFAIDYLSLKYPLKQNNNKAIEEQIRELFMEHFEPVDTTGIKDDETKKKELLDDAKNKIKRVRFLTKDDFNRLVRQSKNNKDEELRRELLLPTPTFFAEISNRKDIPAFWLAGDMEDARRVDAAIEGLSDQKAGVELYYVRIVIEVEK